MACPHGTELCLGRHSLRRAVPFAAQTRQRHMEECRIVHLQLNDHFIISSPAFRSERELDCPLQLMHEFESFAPDMVR